MSIAVGRDTVLVVEDAEAIRKMVTAMLTQSGYNCIEAADGVEALRMAEDGQAFDLVLTDVMMPEMNGAELARHLKLLRPATRLVFMSGYCDDPLVQEMESGQDTVFLAKPFTAASLIQTVRQTLARPQA